MERRKFIIGAGALATGSSAAIGTGAFTSAEAERTVSVQVAGDESAWIGLEPESKYAEINDDDALELDFTDHPDGAGWANKEEGINPNATYEFEGVFSIWMDQAAAHGDYEYYIETGGFDGVDVTIESGGKAASGNKAPPEGTDLTQTWTQSGGPWYMFVDITLESGGGEGAADGTLTIHADKLEE
jgi:hypothetical protein